MSLAFSAFLSEGLIGKRFLEAPEETLSVALMVIGAAIVIICAYLLGSINFAIIISGKRYKDDIRDHGSKNAGMTNMMRTYGKKAAALTLSGDAIKAFVSCFIGYLLIGQLGAYLAGVFCTIGHVFPIFYRFKGGKGVVTAFASILMCDPFVCLILLVLFILIVLISKFISLGSIMCMLLYPLILDRITRIMTLWGTGTELSSPYIIFAVIIAVIIIVKHWENIKRLMNGTENKFSFKKSVKEKTDDEGK